MASGMKKIMSRSGRGSVTIIAALLLSSASIRLLTSSNQAFAQDGQLPTAQMPITAPKPDEPPDKTAAAANNNAKPTSQIEMADRSGMSALIKALKEREAQVSEREKKLELRLQALSIADAEIQKRLESLSDTEQSLRATLSLADEASEKDLIRLTAVYESMKPKDAAALFEEMEPNFAAGFLARMRPDIAASVLAGLSPQIAYSISVILAGRNANAPKS